MLPTVGEFIVCAVAMLAIYAFMPGWIPFLQTVGQTVCVVLCANFIIRWILNAFIPQEVVDPNGKDVLITGGNPAPTAPVSNRNRVQTPSENPCLEALSQDFGRLLGAESDQDVALKCGDRTVGAHKIVLASRSKVFEGMLQSDMVEGRTGQVKVKDMDADVFQEFVKYLYTGTLPKLTEDKAKGLYEAGDLYAVASLMRRCSIFLSDTLTVQNACERLVLADAHSDSEFKERVIAFILEMKVPLIDDHW